MRRLAMLLAFASAPAFALALASSGAGATAAESALADLSPESRGCYRVAAAESAAGPRVAFIAGVADYANDAMDLRNPGRDAIAMTRSLGGLGFDAVVSLNQTGAAFLDCAAEARALQAERAADLSLIYFSGHGLQIDDQNYLALADIGGGAADDGGLAPLADVVAGLQETSGSLVVLLDACRDNPFSQSGLSAIGVGQRSLADSVVGQTRGLRPSVAAARFSRSLLFAYATAPGSVAFDGEGDLSPFTSAFTRIAPTPGWSLTRVFAEVRNAVGDETDWAQTPWVRHSLESEIFLKGERDFAQVLERSDQLAAQAEDRLAVGDKYGALTLALQAIPEGLNDSDLARLERANDALVQAYWSPSAQLDAPDAGSGELGVVMSPDRRRVLTFPQYGAERESGVVLWDAHTGDRIAEVGSGSHGSGAAYMSSTRFAVAKESGRRTGDLVFEVFDYSGRKTGEVPSRCVRDLGVKATCGAHRAAHSLAKPLFATASRDRINGYCFAIWNLETLSLRFEACEPQGEARLDIKDMEFDSAGRLLILAAPGESSTAPARFLIVDADAKAIAFTADFREAPGEMSYGLTKIAVSPNGAYAAIRGWKVFRSLTSIP